MGQCGMGGKYRFEHVALHLVTGSPRCHSQQLHSSDAPLQMQPWAQLAQPTGQHEQQPGDSMENERSEMT